MYFLLEGPENVGRQLLLGRTGIVNLPRRRSKRKICTVPAGVVSDLRGRARLAETYPGATDAAIGDIIHGPVCDREEDPPHGHHSFGTRCSLV